MSDGAGRLALRATVATMVSEKRWIGKNRMRQFGEIKILREAFIAGVKMNED